MTNEPIAWFEQDPDMKSIWYQADKDSPNAIPLYTHPVKELDEQFKKGFEAGKEEGWKAHKFHHPVKELTDEEIGQFKGEWYRGDYASFYDLVRAILRKAQEK